MVSRYKKSGWYNDSYRHSLASKGIKSRNNINFNTQVNSCMNKSNKVKVNYAKIDASTITKLKEFLHKKFDRAVPDHLEQHPNVIKAKQEINNIDHPSKLKQWAIKHKGTLIFLGLGTISATLGAVAGVPTLLQSASTGEIVAVGGTLIGKTGQILGTIFTGGSVLEEAKTISKETFEKHISTEDIMIDSPNPKALVIKVNTQGDEPIDTSSESLSDQLSTPKSLAEISSQQIPYNKLTKKERDVLFSSVMKVKNLLDKRGKSINLNEDNLQVVKRVGPDNTAYGGHQGNLIQIDRDTLKDRNKTEGVLLHEAIHKVYDVRDESRDLENIQIDYLGLSM